MTISITLTPDQERTLEELARQDGKAPSVYVNDMVTAYLNGVGLRGKKTLEDILTPLWEGWQRSGLTEGEIDDLFEHELQEVRRQRHQPKETT